MCVEKEADAEMTRKSGVRRKVYLEMMMMTPNQEWMDERFLQEKHTQMRLDCTSMLFCYRRREDVLNGSNEISVFVVEEAVVFSEAVMRSK
jgi:hypothetical protein